MGKYTVNHVCGHQGKFTLFGKMIDRYRKLEWYEKQDCRACRHHQQWERALKAVQGLDLPPVTGSAAQIKWAETLRGQRIEEIRQYVDDRVKNNRHAVRCREHEADRQCAQRVCEMFAAAIIALVSDNASASWWIDNRDDDVETILGQLTLVAAVKKASTIEQWAHAIVEPRGQTMAEGLLTMWHDMLLVLDYSLWGVQSDLVVDSHTRLRAAFSVAPAPGKGATRLLPLGFRGNAAILVDVRRPQVVVQLLRALASLTTGVLPGCDVGEVRAAADNLAVSLRLADDGEVAKAA